jgi:hypothetical protein
MEVEGSLEGSGESGCPIREAISFDIGGFV